MKRLTDKEKLNDFCSCCVGENCCYDCGDCYLDKLYNRLAELEDKLESGQLVELPCKVGDKVWVITDLTVGQEKIAISEVTRIVINRYGVFLANGDLLLREVYKTQEEAEARLKELEEGL